MGGAPGGSGGGGRCMFDRSSIAAWARSTAGRARQREALRRAAEVQQARLTAQVDAFRRAKKRKREESSGSVERREV